MAISCRDLILILDFGSQYTQLIARRVREQKVYSEIHPFNLPVAKIRELAPRGIILSGGPAVVLRRGRAAHQPEVFELGVPILGICYGAQLTALLLGGKVVRGRPARVRPRDRARSTHAGRAVPRLRRRRRDPGLDEPRRPRRGAAGRVLGDRRERQLPGGGGGGARRASSGACSSIPRWCTRRAAREILANFLFRHLRRRADWTMAGFVDEAVAAVTRQGRRRTGRVICGLSGGVDSSVAAALVLRAIGDAPDLHLRRQRPAARRRGGAGRGAVPRRLQGRPARRRRRASGSSASSPASPTPSRSARSSAASSSPCSRRRPKKIGERGVPGAGDALPRRDRERCRSRGRRRRSRRTTTSAGCPSA